MHRNHHFIFICNSDDSDSNIFVCQLLFFIQMFGFVSKLEIFADILLLNRFVQTVDIDFFGNILHTLR